MIIKENFGRDVHFGTEPWRPASSEELERELAARRPRQLRVLGALHSWNDCFVSDDSTVDLTNLNDIELDLESGPTVAVGAGCTVSRLLEHLRRAGYTLPTYGIVGHQSIAGAIATATHGAGDSTMSHYLRSAQVACRDRDGVTVRQIDAGQDLEAARCAIGCLGAMTRLSLTCRKAFNVIERVHRFDCLEDILEEEERWRLQQFYLIPWCWRWYAQQRSETQASPDTLRHIKLLLRFLSVSVFLNGSTRFLMNFLTWHPASWVADPLRRLAVRFLYRWVFPLLAACSPRLVAHAEDVLMMRDDLFAHVEMELFVPQEHLGAVAALLPEFFAFLAGERQKLSPGVAEVFEDLQGQAGVTIESLRASYYQHYPITFRRCHQDATMISMTSPRGHKDVSAWYAISFITYQKDIAAFRRVARLLAYCLARRFHARPHWGKHFPLKATEVAALYPRIQEFRATCRRLDPLGVFSNDFAHRTIGLPALTRG